MITWVDASAGTGKTYSLVKKIQSLLSNNVQGHEILCVSFSNAAANEMKDRLKGFSSDVNCQTVHSFCNMFFPDIKIIDGIESETLIKKIIDNLLQQDMWFNLAFLLINEWANVINSIIEIIQKNYEITFNFPEQKDFTWTPIVIPEFVTEDLKNGANLEEKLLRIKFDNLENIFDNIFTKDGDLRKRLFSVKWKAKFPKSADWLNNYFETMNDVFDKYNSFNSNLRSESMTKFIYQVKLQYEQEKMKNSVMDFNDLLKKVDFEDLNVLNSIMKIKYIFVDEAQDLSDSQWNVILNLYREISSSNTCDLYVVGDKKQSIYGFQGSDHVLFEKTYQYLKQFAHDYNLIFEHINLNKSYRTSQDLLNFVDKVMSVTNYHTKHESDLCFNGKVEVKFLSDDSVFTDLISQLKSLLDGCYLFSENRLIEPKDILLLIKRRNKSSFRLLHELKKAGIKVQEHPFYIAQDEVVQDILNVAKYILFDDQLALAALLKGPFFCWSYKDLESLFAKSQIDNSEKYEITDFDAKYLVLRSHIEAWRAYFKDIVQFFSSLIFDSEYGKFMVNIAYNSISLFWELVNDFPGYSWFEFINYIQQSKKNTQNSSDGIKIKTIHSSKGLESPIVIVFDNNKYENKSEILMQDGKILFPDKMNSQYKNAMSIYKNRLDHEANRLMYVALTRSKEQLYIFTAQNKFAQILKDAYKKSEINCGSELTKKVNKLL